MEFAGSSRFRVIRLLGTGGMGQVHEVEDREQGLRLALKQVLVPTPEMLLRLKHEFRTLRDLRHPNLVALHELFEDQGRWFFTMELVEGCDFRAWIRPDLANVLTGAESRVAPISRTDAPTRLLRLGAARADDAPADDVPAAPLPLARSGEARLRAALEQLAEGLVALHDAGKMHLDIKPSNLRVTPEGRLVILDFGLARDRGDAQPIAGRVYGSLPYMAPEQLGGDQVGPAADWYSVGALLFEALVGRRPWTGSVESVAYHKLHSDVLPPSAFVPDVPADLDRLCADLLQRAPAARPNGRQVLARLRGGSSASSSSPPAARGATASSPAPQPSVFVGRAEELRRLERALADARGGRTVAVVVQGPSGMGKTTLLDEFAQRVRLALPAALVLRGRCHEREAVPYRAFDGVVDALTVDLAARPTAERAALLAHAPALLAHAFPVLGSIVGADRGGDLPAFAAPSPSSLPPPPSPSPRTHTSEPDPSALRARVFTAFRALLGRVARRAPLLVAVDDLQWADGDSLELLREVLRAPDAPPLLFVATVRDGSGDPWLPQHRGRGGGGSPLGADDVRYVMLRPLPEADALALVDRLGPAALPPDAQAAVVSESAGHPLFIRELVQHYAAAGAASRRRAPGPSLEDALWARVRGLDADARAILTLACVAGAPLPNERVCAAAGLAPEAYAAGALRLQGAHLLRSYGLKRRDVVEPYHDRVRQAVLHRLDAPTLRARHRQLAAALDDDAQADAEALARHWEGAGETARAAGHAERAAVAAEQALAFERAAELYRMALRLSPALPDRPRGALLKRLADALAHAGQSAEAAVAYRDAAALADPAAALPLRRLAAEKFLYSGRLEEGTALLEQVVRTVGLPVPSTPLGSLGSTLWQRVRLSLRGRRFTARPAAEVPAELLERIDAAWAAASGLALVETLAAADFSTRHLRLALDAGEPTRVARALMLEYALISASSATESAAARALREQAWALIETLDSPHARALHHLHEALAMLGRGGPMRRVVALATETDALLGERSGGVAWERATAHLLANTALFYLGEWPELARVTEAQMREAARRGDRFDLTNTISSRLTGVWLCADEVPQAEQQLVAALRDWPRDRFANVHIYELLNWTYIDLYAGRARRAYDRIHRRWWALQRSLLPLIPIFRWATFEARARACLALLADGPPPIARIRLLREARRCIQQIAAGSMAWSRGAGRFLEGGLAAIEGDRSAAVGALEHAEAAMDAAELAPFAVAARRRRGELLGGSRGAALVDAADAWLRARGVVRPARFAAMLLPGSGGTAAGRGTAW